MTNQGKLSDNSLRLLFFIKNKGMIRTTEAMNLACIDDYEGLKETVSELIKEELIEFQGNIFDSSELRFSCLYVLPSKKPRISKILSSSVDQLFMY